MIGLRQLRLPLMQKMEKCAHSAMCINVRSSTRFSFRPRVVVVVGAALLSFGLGCAARAQISRQPLGARFPEILSSVAAYATEDAFGRDIRFEQPVAIASPPGETDRFFVVEKTGRIQLVKRNGSVCEKKLFLDINAMLAAKNEGHLVTSSEMGALGITFHPAFARNGYFYVTYSLAVRENGHEVMFDRLARFSVSKSNPDVADPNSEQPLITQVDEADNHNGGDVHFGADGYLYYSTGDEGNQYDHFDNARHIDKDFFSAIYRLDVDNKPGNLAPNPHKQASLTYPSAVNPGTYKVPADNPFLHAATHNGMPVNAATLRTETWVCGLRNAWRFSFDSNTGRMFIGDVGQDRWEEVDIGVPGGNYGWSYFEGTHEGPRHKDLPANNDCIPPIYEYEHGEGSVFNGIAVIGGIVYHGSRLPELDGTYLFGDYGTRHIWGLQQAGNKWVPSLINTFGGMTAFGTDPANGDALIVDMGGNIGRLVRARQQGEQPPALLSQMGLFSNMTTLEPGPGLVPYEPAQAQWAGNFVARHWFGIPGGDKIIFHTTGNWEFPRRMLWVQHFDAPGSPARKLETRVLVKTEDGIYGLTYKWRDNQQDADLVPEGGLNTSRIAFGPSVHYPARAECAMCHTALVGYAPGFNTWQLNHPMIGNPQANMVKALLDSGYMEDRHRDRDNTWPAYARLTDSTQPLENRVRSYLAVNCASCHQSGGLGLGVWDARPTSRLQEANIVGGSLTANFGDPANRVIAPGDPAHSMMLRRIEGAGVPKMPLVGTRDVDPAAVQAITQWIQSLH
jgi:glucose/arabinose dehydrogenase